MFRKVGEWMPQQPAIANCPAGLEYLTQIDQLLVHQKVELLEIVTSFDTENKYHIKNTLGQPIYSAQEESDCCSRLFCGPIRPFDMKIVDNFGKEVIHLNRPLACGMCCFPHCLQRIEVSAPPGTVIGTVEQEWSIWRPKFAIKDVSGQTVLQIEGPLCTFSLCGDVEFRVLGSDGMSQIGKISKQWSGLARELFTDTDNFGISFPMDLDVKLKALLLGTCFLIVMICFIFINLFQCYSYLFVFFSFYQDFMYFEKSNN